MLPTKPISNAPRFGSLLIVIVADEAFRLKPNIMRPYPKIRGVPRLPRDSQIFNYRLSRARRILENAFGILAQRFCVYTRRMQLKPYKVIIHSICSTTKFLQDKRSGILLLPFGKNDRLKEQVTSCNTAIG